MKYLEIQFALWKFINNMVFSIQYIYCTFAISIEYSILIKYEIPSKENMA